MNAAAQTSKVKGAVVAAFAVGKIVQVWAESPTGDSSDSHLFQIPCHSEQQADAVAAMWRETWGLES